MGKRGKEPRGGQCRCRCGCTIYVRGKQWEASSLCKWCEGYKVFGKEIEPKHVGM